METWKYSLNEEQCNIYSDMFGGICIIPHEGKHKLEHEANAKLIAAAPYLLEALIKIREIATEPNFDIDDIDEIINLSFNATKKATE